MKIAIGCDHIGYPLKLKVIAHLIELGHEVEDVGTHNEERCNYPIYGQQVALRVADGRAEKGILICGTGVGISLSANKVKGIRAVVCSEPYSAQLSRQHNNTNIVAFGSRVVGDAVALQIVDAFLTAEYEGGRHQTRIDMISAIENGEIVQ